MGRVLEGGYRVSGLREGRPRLLDGVRIWNRAGRSTGAKAISLRVLEFAPGVSPGLRNDEADEVLYVLHGRATVYLDGWPYPLGAENGIYLAPGVCLTVDNPGPEPFTLVSSRCPDPADAPTARPARVSREAASVSRPPAGRASCRAPGEGTEDRSPRLVDVGGLRAVTQFVGVIPPGRAGDHFARRVLCILEGRGRMWAGRPARRSRPARASSCPPAGHCVRTPAGPAAPRRVLAGSPRRRGRVARRPAGRPKEIDGGRPASRRPAVVNSTGRPSRPRPRRRGRECGPSGGPEGRKAALRRPTRR